MYPADYALVPCAVSPDLIDGRSFRFGNLTITPFDTPGHCDGHSSMLIEGGELTYFVGGDLIFWGGTIVNQNIHDCSIQNGEHGELRLPAAGASDNLDAGWQASPGTSGSRLRKARRSAERRLGQPPQLVFPDQDVAHPLIRGSEYPRHRSASADCFGN